jgi:hypothetical protein
LYYLSIKDIIHPEPSVVFLFPPFAVAFTTIVIFLFVFFISLIYK